MENKTERSKNLISLYIMLLNDILNGAAHIFIAMCCFFLLIYFLALRGFAESYRERIAVTYEIGEREKRSCAVYAVHPLSLTPHMLTQNYTKPKFFHIRHGYLNC